MQKRFFAATVKHQNRLLCGTGLFLILISFAVRLWLLETRFFDRDELEHLHTAWLTSEGHVLYRDFFQNHTPLLYFVLAPLFTFYDVARDIEDAFSVTFAARRLMWIFSAAIVMLTYWLGRCWQDWRAGLVAAALLTNTVMFLEKSLEIRPDSIAVVCWIGSLVLLLLGVQADATNRQRARCVFTSSGILLGIALMATQKVLFTGLGLSLTMLWYVMDPRGSGVFRLRLSNILLYLLGLSLPILLVLGYFRYLGALGEFIHFNLILNAGWQIHFSPINYLQRLFVQNGLLIAFAVLGFVLLLSRLFTYEHFRRGDFVVVFNGIGLLIGLFLIPVPHRQYFLLFLPLIALYGAAGMIAVIKVLALSCGRNLPKLQNAAFFFLINTGLWLMMLATMISGLISVQGLPISVLFTVVMGLLALALTLFHLLYGFRNTALATLMIAASLYPLKQLYGMFRAMTNEAQTRAIRFVLENTSPQEAVMDGQGGVGVFRPHAYFYWLLDPNIRVILTREQKLALLAALQDGRITPTIINLDEALKNLLPEITEFFTDNYEPVNIGNLWIRKQSGTSGTSQPVSNDKI